MTVTIYHNPRCSKSRQTLELIQAKNISPIIIEYLTSELTDSEIKHIIQLLNVNIRGIIRTTESAYKNLNLADDSLSEQELINAIIDHPELLQRPIVIHNDSAVIGRPPENVTGIL